MKKYKAVMISLDILIAMPIALATVYLLIYSAKSTIGYQLSSSSFYSAKLYQYSISQYLTGSIENGNLDYANAIQLLNSEARQFKISMSIKNTSESVKYCDYYSTCRIVEIGGDSYLLVIGNETTN